MNNKVKKLTYTGLLTGLAIMIPLYFGFLKVIIPPFTATLASHVPMFLSMFLGPIAAATVGLGSAIGFFITATPEVAARAFMHVFVGLVGAYMLKKGISFRMIVLMTAPLHGLLEAIAVIPFGFTVQKVLIVVGVGTMLHHLADGIISFVLVKSLSKTGKSEFIKA